MTRKERGSRGRVTKWHTDILYSVGSVPWHCTAQIRHLLVSCDQGVLAKMWWSQGDIYWAPSASLYARCILCVISCHPHNSPETGVLLFPSNIPVLLSMALKWGVLASKTFHSVTQSHVTRCLSPGLQVLFGATSLSEGSSESPIGAARSISGGSFASRNRLVCSLRL